MATGEAITTEELMATSRDRGTVFRQRVMAGSSLREIASLLDGHLGSSSCLVLMFVASELDCE